MRGARPERALDAVVRNALGLERGARACIACSGGPDSVALASIADRIAREDDLDVVLAHVNHGVRASVGQDECVVLSVAARLGRCVRVARPHLAGDGEAAMRDARYAALTAIARETDASAVLTAHTAEDQTETVLLAMFRGTGPDGLGGIAPRRPLADGVMLVRPLLRVTHAELATELRSSSLPYAIDPTNDDRRYRRNALRGPLEALRAEFPHLDRAVARCAAILHDELAGTERAAERRALRERLREGNLLRDVPFERIEAMLAPRRGTAGGVREPSGSAAADAPAGDRTDSDHG